LLLDINCRTLSHNAINHKLKQQHWYHMIKNKPVFLVWTHVPASFSAFLLLSCGLSLSVGEWCTLKTWRPTIYANCSTEVYSSGYHIVHFWHVTAAIAAKWLCIVLCMLLPCPLSSIGLITAIIHNRTVSPETSTSLKYSVPWPRTKYHHHNLKISPIVFHMASSISNLESICMASVHVITCDPVTVQRHTCHINCPITSQYN